MLMHSTLEEAWGKQHTRLRSYKEPKDVNVSLKNRKSKTKQYFEKSNKSAANNKRYKNMMLMDDEEYANGMLKDPDERYYGYPDSRTFSRTMAAKSKPKSRRIRINPNRNEYVDAEDDSDIEPGDIVEEESIAEEVFEEDVPDNNNDYIFEEVYEEDEDNYLAESLRQKEAALKSKSFTKDPIVEEEQEVRTRYKPVGRKNMPSHDLNQILDLSIYTLSGILLIVILEQFVQLGLKLKSFKPPQP